MELYEINVISPGDEITSYVLANDSVSATRKTLEKIGNGESSYILKEPYNIKVRTLCRQDSIIE